MASATAVISPGQQTPDPREKALNDYRKKLLEHKEIDARLKQRKLLF